MHKIGVLGYPMGASGAIYALYLKFLTQRNLVAEFYRKNVSFTCKQQIGVSEPSLARWITDSRLSIGYN